MSESKGTVNGQANNDTLVKVGEIQIDRLKLDKAVQAGLKKEDASLAQLLQLMDDSWWSQIWLDARVTDSDGKMFATWGKWYADRVKAYPIAKSAITAPFVKKMLENASVREVVAASGMSRGYVHELNLERQGKTDQTAKAKRAARNQGGKKANDAAVNATEAVKATDALVKGADVARIVVALVPLVYKAIDLIAEMDVDTLLDFHKVVNKGATAANAMVSVHERNADIEKVKANETARELGEVKANETAKPAPVGKPGPKPGQVKVPA